MADKSERSNESVEMTLEEMKKLLTEKAKKDGEISMKEISDKLELQKLRNKIDNYDKLKNELESKIKVLESVVKDKQIVDLTEIEKLLSIATEEYKELDKIYTDMNATLVKLKDSTNNIKRYINDNKQVENEYTIIKMLSDTANGTLVGKKKITFENYVQSYFMNTVLV